jgi:hypothetical protein
MQPQDRPAFVETLTTNLEMFDKEAKPATIALWFETLKGYRIEDLTQAFSIHLTSSKFAPKPADIIEIIMGMYWKSADEAWADALRLADQNATVNSFDVVWEAMTGLWEMIEDDKIATRMAFKAAYERIALAGKATGRIPRPQVSVGFDTAQRRDGLEVAYRAGAITAEQARQHLPKPVSVSEVIAIAHNTAEKSDDQDSRNHALQALQALKAMLDKPKNSRITAQRTFEQNGKVMCEINGEIVSLDQLEAQARLAA